MADSQGQNERRRKSREKEQLTRDDWLDAAAGAIAEGGFDNVRVLVLAKKLGVTRGSFYWHFEDHQDLVTSFLKRWRDRRLNEMEYWRPNEADVSAELRRKLHMLLSETTSNTRRLRVELAVRDFARRDPLAAQIVAEVDQHRIAQNLLLLNQLTGNPQESEDLSLLLYVSAIGAQLVLSGKVGDEPAVTRVEGLITKLIARWSQHPEEDEEARNS